MFRSQTMSQIEMAVPESDIVPLVEALAASGIFHSTRTDHLGTEHVSRQTNNWRELVPVFAALEQRILTLMQALDVDEGTPPQETPHLIEPDVAQLDIERLEQEAEAPLRHLEEENRELARLQRQVAQLETIANLEADLDALRHTRYTFVQIGTMPTANLERLESSLELFPTVLVVLRRQEHLATVALFGAQRDADILNRAARSAYLNPLNLSETIRGTPAEAIVALEAGIERTRQHIADYQATIDRLHEKRIDHLHYLLWRVRASRTLSETIASYGRLRYTYLVSGWVPTNQLPALEATIKSVSGQVMIDVDVPGRYGGDPIPVALENPPIARAFQGLVTNYGYPAYGEIDPTLLLAFTFPLIFGLMFGDVGHGLLLALVGVVLVSGQVKPLRNLAGIGPVLVVCGLSSTLFGFVYGSLFGSDEILPWRLIQPMEEIPAILNLAIGVGVVLLSLGMLMNVINAVLARRLGRAIFGHHSLVGMIFYWSLLGLAAGFLDVDLPISSGLLLALAVVSGLAVSLSEVLENLVEGHRPLVEDDLATYLIQIPIELFEVLISLMSNTLSYVRMGAFAVAHGALSMVVFIVAESITGGVGRAGYWIVVALGNLFVIGFEGMIVGIQTLRLEYYEFFSKFFSGGGLRFRPLALITKERE